MWRKLFKIFGGRVIQTQDFDDEVRTRCLKKDVFGLYCTELLGMPKARLNADGTVSRACFVSKWKEI